MGGARCSKLARMQTCELDGAFVGLRARVREKRLPRFALVFRNARVEQIGQLAGHFAATLDVVVVAHMHERFRLRGKGGGNGRVAVPQAHGADTGYEIEVFVAGVVVNVHALAAHQTDRLAPESVHDVGFLKFLFHCKTHGATLSKRD